MSCEGCKCNEDVVEDVSPVDWAKIADTISQLIVKTALPHTSPSPEVVLGQEAEDALLGVIESAWEIYGERGLTVEQNIEILKLIIDAARNLDYHRNPSLF